VVLTAMSLLTPGHSGVGVDATNHGERVSTRQLLSALPIRAAHLQGYDRDKFKLWDSQGNGCDTRDVVLIRGTPSGSLTSD
jgi:hypothetical protein